MNPFLFYKSSMIEHFNFNHPSHFDFHFFHYVITVIFKLDNNVTLLYLLYEVHPLLFSMRSSIVGKLIQLLFVCNS
jgi:hypothetical protein